MNRHAYMIICHNNFEILEKLLTLLDDKRNDIYIHIDKKVKSINKNTFYNCVKSATVTFVNSVKVSWGGYSQIKAELILLSEATKKKHSYYHLISGVDFPLKTQNEIHSFFEKNEGKEFIDFDNKNEFSSRIKYYYFFQDKIGRGLTNPNFFEKINSIFLFKLNNKIMQFQKNIKTDRTKKLSVQIYKGTNWFSITHDLAVYVLSKKRFIKRHFKYSLCADEVFLHTIVMNSPFKDRITNDCLRFIDWNRGGPYTFTKEDYQLLTESNKFFARKFDYSKYPEIIDMLYDNLTHKQMIDFT